MNGPLRLGLLGRDIGRSRSPDLHAAALRLCKQDGTYRLFDHADVKDAQAVIELLRGRQLHGLNVTTPYKVWAAAACHVIGDGAGAPNSRPAPLSVNTLFMHDNFLHGASTDGPGLCDALRWAGVRLRGRQVALIGCGGAGQGIASALLAAGLERLVVCNRDPAKARQLHEYLKDSRVSVGLWGVRGNLADADLAIHATRLGHGAEGLQADVNAALSWLPWSAWCKRATLLVDLGYASGDTPWQALARREGLGACILAGSGQAMLSAQAARSFALWTGCSLDGRDLLPSILPQGYQLYMSEP